jgi:hypothetical protein
MEMTCQIPRLSVAAHSATNVNTSAMEMTLLPAVAQRCHDGNDLDMSTMDMTCNIPAASRVRQNMNMTCMSARNMDMTCMSTIKNMDATVSEEMDVTSCQPQRVVNKSCMDMTCMVAKSMDMTSLTAMNMTAMSTGNTDMTSMEMTCQIPRAEVEEEDEDDDAMNTTHFHGVMESSENIGEFHIFTIPTYLIYSNSVITNISGPAIFVHYSQVNLCTKMTN